MALGCAATLTACGAAPEESAPIGESTESSTTSAIKYVFVIAMENHDSTQIYGDSTDAPYINGTLVPKYARATNFNDELALNIPSEPHYVWMEAGTNAFSGHTFKSDSDPSKSNSTSSTAHLTTQIKNATNGVTWRTYQEGINATTGSCPITSSGFYAAKHNPFVFFQDVSGATPSKTNAYCVARTRPYSSFAADLAGNDMASYTFITPNLCNDMHGASGCPNANTIQSGDQWLAAELPRLITWVGTHAGVIFLTWDEGSSTGKVPFIAIGPGVKANYNGTVAYTHGSLVKSIETILQLSILPTVSTNNDLADLFKAGSYP
jgi:hypothetical protein